MSKKLTEQDFQKAAKRLDCEVAEIRAVDDVESRGEGFYTDGFPTILFERHKFRQFTNGKFNATHPRLSGAQGGYGKAGQNQRNKFNQAFALNPIAAMKSCSWGRYQIMGFNHAVCGFATVGEFVDAMKESEGAQLLAFVNFVINNNLADELRNKNWKGFARGYNGQGYAKNNYDTKMAAAYKKFAAQKDSAAASSKLPTEKRVELNSNNSQESANNEPPPDDVQTTENTQTAENITNISTGDKTVPDSFVAETKEVEPPPKENSTATAAKMTIGGFVVPTFLVTIIGIIKSSIEQGYLSAASVGETVLNFVANNTKYFFGLIGLVIVGVMLKKLYKQVSFIVAMWLTANPNMHDIVIKKDEK